MSFLFKSKPSKGSTTSNQQHAGHEYRASDSSAGPTSTLDGSANGTATPGSPIANSHPINGLSDRIVSSAGVGLRNQQGSQQSEEKGTRNVVSPGPEQKMLRERGGSDLNKGEYVNSPRNVALQPRSPPLLDSSPYPWSQRRLNFAPGSPNPFPRYGAAVNASSGKDGVIYMMGGLINGTTVKGDLWMLEAGNGSLGCHQVATTSEGPGPRVGHASLLVGNAFIVFGGDTKMDEGDLLDDTLYLLNTSTKQWSRALPAGPRPPGRYGHTLNILGSKIYIFGGQVEGYFFNDLVAFDLNALQQTSNRWEILIQNTIDGGPPHGQIPPARTNHTMINWGDKLYLFGGTDGMHWFNDVWAYSPASNSWSQLDCIGYIPSPREGHAAALVNDVMYIFGGRNEEGSDLGDLAAFRISARRWYTFQNMGPSPSPRSGHSMTTVGKSIVVLAGEPSSAPRDAIELAQAYFLDTNKIRYPADNSNPQPAVNDSRPSNEIAALSQTRGPSKEIDTQRSDSRMRADSAASRQLRAGNLQGQPLSPAPLGPPPQAPMSQGNGPPSAASRQPTRSADRPNGQQPNGNNYADHSSGLDPNRRLIKPETYQPSQDSSTTSVSRSPSQHEIDASIQSGRQFVDTAEHPAHSRLAHADEYERPQDSGIGSSPAFAQQRDDVLHKMEQLKQKNAWFASELALARKSGYQARDTDSPAFDTHAVDNFGDEDRPLVEALLKMRAELTRVQEAIDEQSRRAAARIAEVEKQRDTAVNEAVFAKAKLAGQGSPHMTEESRRGVLDVSERNNEISRKLAASLATQREFSQRVEALAQELDSERVARRLAEEIADATQKRASELEHHRQKSSAELEDLRGMLHEAQKEARELSGSHTAMSSQHKLLELEHSELSQKLQNAQANSEDYSSALASLREAVASSADKSDDLAQRLENERNERDLLERELRTFRAEHEANQAALSTATKRLRDAEDSAKKHAEEARKHRDVVLQGLDRLHQRSSPLGNVSEEKLAVIQQQADAANVEARQNQKAADIAAEKLRSAEERIAGLEAYQEQASRESLSIRKQLQNAIKDNQAIVAEKHELEQRFQNQVLETNALKVQHVSLKDILGERGINAAEVRRSRAVDSPSSLSKRFSTPDLQRVKELESQLEASLRTHEEMRAQFEDVSERDEKMKREYEEKLTALDNDHQAAVKYLRGTEKMLSKMKQELQRVKNENAELKKRSSRIDSREGSPMIGGGSDWDQEREKLQTEHQTAQNGLKKSISTLETRIREMENQLQAHNRDLERARQEHTSTKANFDALKSSHDRNQSQNNQLQKDNLALEERARQAEERVQLLLDRVEHSVDNYRRQSRMAIDGQATTMNGIHHARNLSAESGVSAVSAISADPLHKGHARNTSDGAHSLYSLNGTSSIADGRDSMALDSLASELDALRSQWETTTKNYRISDKFDFEQAPTSSTATTTSKPSVAAFGGSMATWRRDLDVSDDGSRPGTSDGTVRGDISPQFPVAGGGSKVTSGHSTTTTSSAMPTRL